MTRQKEFWLRNGRIVRVLFLIFALSAALLALVLSVAGQEGTAVDAGRAAAEPVLSGPAAPNAGSNSWGNPLPEQINYQGQLVDNSGQPQTGLFTLTFNVLSGPPGFALLYSESQTVTADADGLFDVMIGSVQPGLRSALDGGNAWLEIALNGELLAPRQPIGSVAYALYAQHLAGGTGTDSVIAGGRSNNASGNEAVVGGGLSNAATANQATVSGGWTNSAGGVLSTIAGGSFNTTISSGAVIGGGSQNTVSGTLAIVGGGFANYVGANYANISGGRNNDIHADYATIGGGQANLVNESTDHGTIGGGWANVIDDFAGGATIGGGYTNYIDALYSTIGGGEGNRIGRGAFRATIGGGTGNQITQTHPGLVYIYDGATIAGGTDNKVGLSNATIGGGINNFADGRASTIPGGRDNDARGDFSFAAGYDANADHEGAFVWSSVITSFTSTGDYQFLIDAPGGVGMGMNAPRAQLDVVGTKDWATGFVTVIENNAANSGTSGRPNVLALMLSNVTDPDAGNNYINFFDQVGYTGAIEGNGSGGIALNTSGADFAEYLPLNLTVMDEPEPGTVLGLDAGGLQLETATAVRLFVMSSAPGFIGNAPGENTSGMALVAFMGQVPVQVRGPVQAGDLLVASGLNDGTAVAITAAQLTPDLGNQIVGQALAGSSDPGIKLVNTLVGQPTDAFWSARLADTEARLANTEAQLADLAARLDALEAAAGEETGED